MFEAATVPPLAVANVNALATVMEAVVRSVPPDNVTAPFGLFKLVGLDIESTPALMVVPPV